MSRCLEVEPNVSPRPCSLQVGAAVVVGAAGAVEAAVAAAVAAARKAVAEVVATPAVVAVAEAAAAAGAAASVTAISSRSVFGNASSSLLPRSGLIAWTRLHLGTTSGTICRFLRNPETLRVLRF